MSINNDAPTIKLTSRVCRHLLAGLELFNQTFDGDEPTLRIGIVADERGSFLIVKDLREVIG